MAPHHTDFWACDWSRAGKKAAIVTIFRYDIIFSGHHLSKRTGSKSVQTGSKNYRPEVKMSKGDFIEENLSDLVLHVFS